MDSYDATTGEILPANTMPPEIAKAIVAVEAEMKTLGADDKNAHGGYAFVSVDKFYEVVGRKMAEHGLALLIDEVAADVREGAKGNAWLFTRYVLTFMHASGALSPPMRRSCAQPISGPQAFGAAQSYIEKQFLRQVFKIPTGDRDADAEPQDGGAPMGRYGGRTAQEVPAPQSGGRQSENPAPEPPQAPSGREQAQAAHNTIMTAINTASASGAIDNMMSSNDWKDMERLVRAAEGDKAEGIIARIRRKAEDRRAELDGGYPQ